MRRLLPPEDDADCGWFQGLEPAPPARSLQGDLRVDCAVVGAGFTGLAVARRLAELRPRWSIAVLEAQRAGYGSSARSSGFVVDLAGFVSRLPKEAAEAVIRLSRRGIRLLRRRVSVDGIDAAWDERGWFHVAATPQGQRSLEALRSWLAGRGEAYDVLDRGELAKALGTSYYRQGLRLPGSVLVQPGALVRGLAENLPDGVQLYEGSPVSGLEKGGLWRLRCIGGTVVSDRVFLATNAALGTFRPLRSRVFPLMTFGSLTRALTSEEQDRLGGETEWGILAQEPLGSSIRRTRGQRILIRNTLRYRRRQQISPSNRAFAAEVHRKSFLDRFPQLARVKFESTWAGSLGMTANHGFVFGAFDDGLFAAGGYSGAGIALGTAAGHLLADLALDEPSRDLDALRGLPGPRWIPPEPLLGLGVRLHVARLEAFSRGKI